MYFACISMETEMNAQPLLDPSIPIAAYHPVDLSTDNPALGQALQSPQTTQQYLDRFLAEVQGLVAYGGYLEKRTLYKGFDHFRADKRQEREYHLGVDFWAPAGTSIHTPWKGRVHSWANRMLPGDYGPVIILEHHPADGPLYSLFGHLATKSLDGLFRGKLFEAGQRIGWLGNKEENGGYAPHLHFQFIRDLQGFKGDYPGVCAFRDLGFYRQNCPDPLPLLDFFEG